MTRIFLISILLFHALVCFSLVERQFTMVHFASDEYTLDPQARTTLEELMSSIDLNADHEFLLEGHTDAIGSYGYNEALAMERAVSVRSALLEFGIDPQRVNIRALGERAPRAGNTFPDQRQQNRRVEITFQRYALVNVDELHDALDAVRPEIMTIDPSTDSWVTTSQGVSLYLPANALVLPDGTLPNGPVRLSITEALQLDAMLVEGLSTMADGKLLETGGMIKLGVETADGRELQLVGDKAITLSIPAPDQQPGMELFLSDDGGNWTATGQASRQMPEFNLPPRPFFRWPSFDRPVFEAETSTRPRRPTDPVMPSEPKAPRQESYRTAPEWYHFLVRKRIAEQDDMRYAQALEAHEDRLEKYEQEVISYEKACAEHPQALVRYEERMASWLEQVAQDRTTFEREIVPAAMESHKRKVKAVEVHYEKVLDEWNQCYAEEQERYLAVLDSLGILDTRSVGGYVFMTNTLGWINCDRFYNVPDQMKQEVVVNDPDQIEKRVILVFNDIKSMVNVPRTSGGEFRQPGIPCNEKVTLLAYSIMNGQVNMQVANVTGKANVHLALKPSSMSDLRKAIQDLQTGS